jgi:hypothetical protein
MLCAFLWVISRPLNFVCMKMEQTECSEKLAYKIQTPGNYPEESIQPVKCFRFVIQFSLTISPLEMFRRHFQSPSEEVEGLYDVDIVCKFRYCILLYTNIC